MTDKKIAVLLPCYNEEQTIEKVVRDFKRELPEATIYVYNNNSTDRTAEIAASIEGVVVRNEYRQGTDKTTLENLAAVLGVNFRP